MPETQAALRIALIAGRDGEGKRLRGLLQERRLEIVHDDVIDAFDPRRLADSPANVVLVNLDEQAVREIDRLEALIEESALPLMFNEGGVPDNPRWADRLVAKLRELVEEGRPQPVPPETGAENDVPVPPAPLQVVEGSGVPAQEIWVLGASLGGPQAVKAFLKALPHDLPVALLLAQHIGQGFVPLLAEQLQRATGWPVSVAAQGDRMLAGRVYVVPVDCRFVFDHRGRVQLRDEEIPGPYRPSIDDVLEQAAETFGERAGAIIFSGMGEDGATGVREIERRGGTVLAQDADSCIIGSMPEAARRAVEVAFSGPPAALADVLAAEHAEGARQ
ncbi:MAG TPA: chemotaxis protein CheB [Thiotrichales bacterium]|nr:chemotaxis protein CheB [Thiotrichales bacterium]